MADNKPNDWEEVNDWQEVPANGSSPTPKPDINSPDAVLEALKSTGSGVLKALSYPGEFIKTGLLSPYANLKEVEQGKKGKMAAASGVLKDLVDAGLGKAPRAKEYANRIGLTPADVKKGASWLFGESAANLVPENTLFDLTTSGVDLGSEMVGGGLAAKALKGGGRKLFNSAFKEADEIARLNKKEVLPSDVAWRKNIAGSDRAVNKKVLGILDDLQSNRESTAKSLDMMGAQLDLDRAASPVKSVISQWKGGHNTDKANAAAAFESYLDEAVEFAKPKEVYSGTKAIVRKAPVTTKEEVVDYASGLDLIGEKTVPRNLRKEQVRGFRPPQGYEMGPREILEDVVKVDLQRVPVTSYGTPEATSKSGMKLIEKRIPGFTKKKGAGIEAGLDLTTTAYGKAGSGAWKDFAMTSEGQKLAKLWSKGLREEVKRTANATQLGMGNKISMINEDMGALLTPRGVWGKEVLKESRRPDFSQVDAMALAVDPTVFAAKQAGKFIGSTLGQTRGGQGLYKAGQVVDATKVAAPVVNNLTRDQMKVLKQVAEEFGVPVEQIQSILGEQTQ